MGKIRTPLVTVLVVVVFGVVLLLVNQARDPGVEQAAAAPTAAPPSSAAAAPTTTAPPAEQKVYTGHAQGSRLAVAVGTRGDKAAGYLCDGKVEAWVQGSRSGDAVTMQSKDGAYRVTGTVAGEKVDGTVELPGGRSYRYDADVAGPPAGLYERRAGAGDRTGWIVLPDGSQVGARTLDGVTTGAPPLDAASGTATVDGQSVPVGTFDVASAG
jgi:hypothetical protein